MALAWLEMSTGEFRAQAVEPRGLAAVLARIGPGELLVPEKLLAAEPLFELWAEWKAQLTPLPNARFDSENARRRRSEERRVGKEWVRTCRSRWSPDPSKKKKE